MPFYEYECSNCKFYTELLQKVSDPPLKKCPSCKKATMKKLVSAPVFRLKGGGWYETDFKSDKEGRRNLAADPEPAANDSSMESKSDKDAKPAAGAAESKPAESKAAEGSSGKAEAESGARPRRAPAAKPVKSAAASKRAPARPKARTKAPARKKRR
jgi:putative FmdB family regulatory protein